MFSIVGRLLIALIGSFAIFTLVAFLHGFFGDALQNKKNSAQPQLVSMAIPKKHEEEPKPQQHIRILKAQTGKTGNSGASPSNMRFVPDLGAQSGPEGANGAVIGAQELGAEVFDEGQTDEPAVAVYSPAAAFPDRARELNIEGTVKAVFVVNYLGKVINVDVVKSSDQSFTREVKKTLATWRFKPARNKGVPVNMRFSKEIEFKLE
jgi:TonB family protein